MVVRVEKEEALAALEAHRHAIDAEPGSCVMCRLVEGRSDPPPLVESRGALVLLDRFGARPGHLIVVAKQHVENLEDLPLDHYLEFQRLAHEAAGALKQALSPTRIFVASLGAPKAVPMSFPHFHLHVIPLFENDERCRPARVFSWTDGVVLYSDETAQEYANRIRAAWPAKNRTLRVVDGDRQCSPPDGPTRRTA